MQPALPSTPTFELEHYLSADKWAAQQKIDGERLFVAIKGGNCLGVGRDGSFKMIPKNIKQALAAIRGQWMFDGEIVDSEFYIFDILEFPKGNIATQPFVKRNLVLSTIFDNATVPFCKYVPAVFGEQDKKDFYTEAVNSSIEGLIFRQTNAPYVEGRTDTLIKYKFVKTVDCFVVDTHVDGKDNLVIAVFDGEKIHPCGKVSALTGDGPRANIGDVVEVRFLYVTGSNKLFQPTAPRLRLDKKPQECTIDQLTVFKTNKQLLERKTNVNHR